MSGGVGESSFTLSSKTTPDTNKSCSIIESSKIADALEETTPPAELQSESSPSIFPSLSSSTLFSQPSSYSSSESTSAWAKRISLLSIRSSVESPWRRSEIDSIDSFVTLFSSAIAVMPNVIKVSKSAL